MLLGKNNKDLDYKKINQVISLTNKILKILFIVLIVGCIYLSLVLLKETKIMNFLGTALSIVSPLFIGLIIMWLFNPFINWLKKKGVKRIWGTIITYIILVGFLAVVVGTIIPLLTNQLYDFAATLPEVFGEVGKWLTNAFDKLSDIKGLDVTAMKDKIFENIQEYGTNFTKLYLVVWELY